MVIQRLLGTVGCPVKWTGRKFSEFTPKIETTVILERILVSFPFYSMLYGHRLTHGFIVSSWLLFFLVARWVRLLLIYFNLFNESNYSSHLPNHDWLWISSCPLSDTSPAYRHAFLFFQLLSPNLFAIRGNGPALSKWSEGEAIKWYCMRAGWILLPNIGDAPSDLRSALVWACTARMKSKICGGVGNAVPGDGCKMPDYRSKPTTDD